MIFILLDSNAPWQQLTALVTLTSSGVISNLSLVPQADVRSPSALPVTLTALERTVQSWPARSADEMLRSAIVNVSRYFLRMAQHRSPAEMEAIIWQHDSIGGADHGASCAAFASLTLELAAQVVGQQSWVTGGTSYPWPLHRWVDARVDPNAASPGIVSIVQDAQAHHRWHPLGDGYTPLPGDWVLFSGHVEVVTSYSGGVLSTIGGDSLPNYSVNAHEYRAPLAAQGVAGFVNNGHLGTSSTADHQPPTPRYKPAAASLTAADAARVPGLAQALASPLQPHTDAPTSINGAPGIPGVRAPVMSTAPTPSHHHHHLSHPAASSAKSRWLLAERQQETGYPAGNYRQNSAGCAGAYCWSTQKIWQHMASAAGIDIGRYPNAYDAPPAVQDRVAWSIMGPYVNERKYAQAAEIWNGGVPYPVPNPVLGSSAAYANEVIHRFNALPSPPPAVPRPARPVHHVTRLPHASKAVQPPVPGTTQYRTMIPLPVQHAFAKRARNRLRRSAALYEDIARSTGVHPAVLAACDWMQCAARPRYSPVHGEKLGTLGPTGAMYRTKSQALARCARDLIALARSVYSIDITVPRLPVYHLANAFAAFRWGGLLKRHGTSSMEFPYAVAGLTDGHLRMRWPDIPEPTAPDKPGSRFRAPFGAVPVVLLLGYPATA